MASQAGGVLLVEKILMAGLGQVISAALAPWRKQWAVHDPGKILMDVSLAIGVGGDSLADVGMLRAGTGVFGAVASGPTISRLVDTWPGPDRGPWGRSGPRKTKIVKRCGSWLVPRRRMQADR
nr:transposase [Streptomyces sp. BK022]